MKSLIRDVESSISSFVKPRKVELRQCDRTTSRSAQAKKPLRRNDLFVLFFGRAKNKKRKPTGRSTSAFTEIKSSSSKLFDFDELVFPRSESEFFRRFENVNRMARLHAFD